MLRVSPCSNATAGMSESPGREDEQIFGGAGKVSLSEASGLFFAQKLPSFENRYAKFPFQFVGR